MLDPLKDSNSTLNLGDSQEFPMLNLLPVCPQANYSKTVSEHIPNHVYDEDCLRLNIWTPVPDPNKPDEKWPVMVWFHGGWFQVGDPSQEQSMDPTELISTGKLRAVFVAVGYRLNVFGFLAGSVLRDESNGEAVGNYGLWDQRLAMDWVYNNITAFGGDQENIVLAGRSAGAYSVLAQVLHDFRGKESYGRFVEIYDSTRLLEVNRFLLLTRFKRLVMYSNAIPTQPKTPEDCDQQFNELCEYFDVPKNLDGAEKMRMLRSISAEDLCAGIMELQNHTFRPVTDNLFIHSGIFEYYRDGSFAAEFKKRDLRLFSGEVLDEDTLYAVTNPPDPNVSSLRLQVSNYYPPKTTDRLLDYYQLPQSDDKKQWQQLFGRITADGQVRAPSRYLVDNLIRNGVEVANVWRYLIAYPLSFITEQVAPASFGVSHAMDRPIWNYSITHGPALAERRLMDDWIQDLCAFVRNQEGYTYGTTKADECKVMTAEGRVQRRAQLQCYLSLKAGADAEETAIRTGMTTNQEPPSAEEVGINSQSKAAIGRHLHVQKEPWQSSKSI
ncbi:triacylglycerol lipase II precursor [Fusarium albosuccineum]|uniref:Carboxylic ester hydrolase n=1 Tax=Fusarium albosuccineum TaxID=1237068 RepID=A0A8H4PCD6_9HYPO|nr:triacylglycerol lipase II precursor [Fusarium albosuccineum]